MFSYKQNSSEASRSGSVLDEYSNKVFKLVVIIVPVFFLCGNATMTIMYYMGLYPAVSGIAMWCSNAVDICYMAVGVHLIKTSYGPDGMLIRRKLQVAKTVLMVMVVVQWNLNSYICPFTDFWAYAPLFVIVEALFFDDRLVRRSTFLILLSMIISWMVNGDNLLPADDEYYYLNLIFRGIGLAFTLFSINIITWFGKVFIIEAIAFREKERELREKNFVVEREARLKSDFLANMSHEIRTPMNAVIGMAEIAMREEMSPAAKDCLGQIQKSGHNLLNIINDILDYSKIESGKMEIISERYEPSSELNDISNILATRIGDKKLELYIAAYPGMPHALLGDAMRIRQILINLANNAIKFTNEGSVKVIVSCEYTDTDTVMLTYHIKDTGIGIREYDMDKLFVSFQQVDSRRNRSVEGTGLGLAISEQLVKAMDGSIGVNSEYGVGSDFWFTIPQKVLDPASDYIINNVERKRAVVIDNDPVKVNIFTDEVKRLGITGICIADINEYKPEPGYKDYIFFDYTKYNSVIRDFLGKNLDVTGVIMVEFNSDFMPDRNNLYVLRRPMFTNKLVRLLNDVAEDVKQFETEEAYAINFIAPSANILIVDDNPLNIAIAEGLLAPMKMNIDQALSGPEAIKKIQEKDYDIVLMDHMMPGMDGVDATRIIRRTTRGADLVIIALSANAIEEARKMFLESGMNDFIAKPIEIKDMVAKIRKWLPEEKKEKGALNNSTEEDTPEKKETENLPDDYSFEDFLLEEESQDEDVLDRLEELDILDVSQAIELVGSPEMFLMIVEEYYKFGEENYDGIVNAYKDEDLTDFTTRVHTVKSSSRQIGAYILGDMAEALEKAGKDGDMDYVKANTEDMLNAFREVLDRLGEIFAE